MLPAMLADLRLAFRSIRRRPGFAAVVVATLALGIGANTAMFTLVHATLLRPLPYSDPERLVLARRTAPSGIQNLNSTPDFYDYREQVTSFESLVAAQGISLRATLLAPAERVLTTRVSSDFFSVLGVKVAAGRAFAASDGVADAPRVVMIGESLATRRFGTPQAAVGRTMQLAGLGRDDLSPVVVGVVPAAFRFMGDADVWLPMRKGENDAPQTRNQHRWVLVGRLKKGVTLEAAGRQADEVAARLQALYPASNRGKGLRLDPLQTALSESRRPRLLMLSGAVGLVLLVACANVAGLLLARGASRRSELAVRRALGATRGRIAAMLLTESAVLATLAGAVGLVLATWLQRLLAVAAGMGTPGMAPAGASLPLLLFAFGLSLVTGLVFGAVPAVTASGTRLTAQLSPGTRSAGAQGSTRMRSILVATQVAVSMMLIVGAGLLLRSFVRLNATTLGFEAQHLLAGTIQIPRTALAGRGQFCQALRDDLAALPGVTGVGFVSHLPIRDRFDDLPVWVTGQKATDGSRERTANMRLALPGYFETMGIPIVAGRDIGDADRATSARVLVVSESLARRFFPGEDPLGRHLTVTSQPAPVDFEVVGVVADARINGVALPAPMTMYAPAEQFWEANPQMSFVVRTALTPAALSETVRRLVVARNPNVPMERLVTMESLIGDTLLVQRVTTMLLALLSAVAMLLAAVGLYGVLACHVTERTRELGVRMALGATPRVLITGVLARGAWMVLPGLAVGLLASRAASHLLAKLLYEVPLADPITYGGAGICLATVALAASAWPACRAARVNPVEALRGE